MRKEKIIRSATCGFCLLALILLPACSDQSGGDWHDIMTKENSNKEDYIRTQQELGVDPEQAKKQYELNNIILRTEGKNPGAYK
jgi:hypothetical protein